MLKFQKIISIILVICMTAGICSFGFTSTAAENNDDIDSLEQQLEELEKKNAEYQEILDSTQEDIEEKEEYRDALVSKISVLDDKIVLTHQSIDELNTEIEEKKEKINQANENIDAQMDTLCERLRMIYMAGNATDLEIILGAKDFSDFIDKVQLVKTLSEYDEELIESINSELEKITLQKAELEEDRSELEEKETSLEEDQEELNTLLEENDELLKTLYADSESAQKKIDDSQIVSADLESEIQAYYDKIEQEKDEAEAKAKAEAEAKAALKAEEADDDEDDDESSSGSSSGSSSSGTSSVSAEEITSSGYVWPCPGYYTLTSEWNEDRGSYNHGAIDISGSGIMGSTVVAADGGTVVTSNNSCSHNWGKYYSCGCGGGYGNYVLIDHGNGKMTLYAHLTSSIVSAGQTVSKGQTIGYVGSTGESTGAHLHFECRLYGEKYNPMLEY